MRKILVLASNPLESAHVRVDEEVRDIREGLQRARWRDEFELVQRWAVRPRDFQRAMLEEVPQIVHFSGHGMREPGLCFEDEGGNPRFVLSSAIASLFKLVSQKVQVECVVLNGCYDHEQAAAIAEHVPFVMGVLPMSASQAAVEFAVGFYDALGHGDAVPFAFEAAKVAIQLTHSEDISVEDMPVLITGKPREANAESLQSESLQSARASDGVSEPQVTTNVIQQGKYNINIGQATGLTIGDG